MGLTGAFKRDAEQMAEEIRHELGLSNIEALGPFLLLEHLDIPAIGLTDLAALTADDDALHAAVDFLRSEETTSLSALTVFLGSRRLIIYNDGHTTQRRNSDLCHEAGHALLMHPPAPHLDDLGCRTWNQQIEDEAQFLAGALLVPGKAARYAAKASWTHEQIGSRFGCSHEMARWRDNVAGGLRLRKRK